MNERIRELLVEAREQTKEGSWNAPTAVWAEKFAELIVGECAQFCEDKNSKLLGTMLKEHFGVEE